MERFHLKADEIKVARESMSCALTLRAVATTLAGSLVSIPAYDYANNGIVPHDLYATVTALAFVGFGKLMGRRAMRKASKIVINYENISQFDKCFMLPHIKYLNLWEEAGKHYMTLQGIVEEKTQRLDAASVLYGFFLGGAAQIGGHNFHHLIGPNKEAIKVTVDTLRPVAFLIVSWIPSILANRILKKIKGNVEHLSMSAYPPAP
jgi:hypothetical protein